jgi:hypothetical protein
MQNQKTKIGQIITINNSTWECVLIAHQFKSWKCVEGRKSINVMDRTGRVLFDKAFNDYYHMELKKQLN